MRTNSRRARALLIGAIGAAGLLLLPSIANAAEVQNGSFENGTAGWTLDEWPESGGFWSDVEGDVAPISEEDIPAPSCDAVQALYDEDSPTSAVLFQDLVVEAGATSALTFTHWYENFDLEQPVPENLPEGFAAPAAVGDPIWGSPDTLDPGFDGVNQQYRIDIISTDADPFSVAPADVLLSIFATNPGDPAVLAPMQMSVDLSKFAGQTVRLRFAAVNNDFTFLAGVDCVALASTPIPTTTTTTTAAPAAAAAAAVTPTFTG